MRSLGACSTQQYNKRLDRSDKCHQPYGEYTYMVDKLALSLQSMHAPAYMCLSQHAAECPKRSLQAARYAGHPTCDHSSHVAQLSAQPFHLGLCISSCLLCHHSIRPVVPTPSDMSGNTISADVMYRADTMHHALSKHDVPSVPKRHSALDRHDELSWYHILKRSLHAWRTCCAMPGSTVMPNSRDKAAGFFCPQSMSGPQEEEEWYEVGKSRS